MLSGVCFLAVCFFVVTAAASNITITEILAETPSCAVGFPSLEDYMLLTLVAWLLYFGAGFSPDAAD